MAIYDAGYLSPIKNKLGNAVGRRWRNLNVLAVYNGSPRNPRTSAQMLQRRLLSAMSELSAGFAMSSMLGFRNRCAGTKVFPRAMFIKKNFGVAHVDGGGSISYDYADIVVSQGSVGNVNFGAPSFDDPLTAHVGFDAGAVGTYPSAVQNDCKVRVVVYCADTKQSIMSPATALSAGGVDVVVPAYWNGMTVRLYGFVEYTGQGASEYGLEVGECSNSVFIGQGNIG